MRFPRTYWYFNLALVWISRAWATKSNERNDQRWDHGDRHSEAGAQEVVAGEDAMPSSPSVTVGQLVGSLSPTSLPTKKSGAIVQRPRITDGPSLVGRKLGMMRWDVLQDGFLGKRDAGTCASSLELCPSSVGGGCCPSNSVCGTSSCYPVTAGAASACGLSGYFGCPIADGGGCCPTSFVCETNSCSPSPGISSLTCSAGFFQCPASLGGGCCTNGMGCNLYGCYTTTPQTVVLIETSTTQSSSDTITFTTTIILVTIQGSPDPTQTVSTNGMVAQAQAPATAVAKSTTISNSDGGGLSAAALGGIIGGAIVFLLAILVAASYLIRSLNRVSRAQEAANKRSESNGPRSGSHRPSLTRSPDINKMSIDPSMMTGPSTTGSVYRPSGSETRPPLPEMEGSGSPPVFVGKYSPKSPPHTHYSPGYNQVAGSEGRYSHGSSGYRNPSLDSSPSNSTANEYFNLPIQKKQNPNRVSMTSSQGRSSQHKRNWSNASDISNTSVELDAGQDGTRKNSASAQEPEVIENGRKRSSSLGSWMSKLSNRRGSEPEPVLQGGPVREEAPTPGAAKGLGGIAEADESQVAVDEYRGSPRAGRGVVAGASSGGVGLRDGVILGMPVYADSDEGRRRGG